jgi:hypothetical protein
MSDDMNLLRQATPDPRNQGPIHESHRLRVGAALIIEGLSRTHVVVFSPKVDRSFGHIRRQTTTTTPPPRCQMNAPSSAILNRGLLSVPRLSLHGHLPVALGACVESRGPAYPFYSKKCIYH